MRALIVLACCVLWWRASSADVGDQIQQLEPSNGYKVRLAAALSLAKSSDARAVIALAGALRNDSDAKIRRVGALALEKMITASTPDDAKQLGLSALGDAAKKDSDADVRRVAARAVTALAALAKAKPATAKKAAGPSVFVNIDATTDQSKKAPSDASQRLTRIVKASVERTGYATSWPGGLPTSADLSSSRSRAFIVASTVKKLDITKAGSQTQIACTVVVRVAPWTGTDGGERWEANRAASASGSAKATTGTRDRDITAGVRDCLEAVAEDVTSRQVVPFLKRLASAGT